MKSSTLATLFAALLTSHKTLAHPLSARQNSTTIYTTSFTTYIADYTCGADGEPLLEFPGNISSGVCVKFRADSYKITPLPDLNCTFSTFNGDVCAPAQLDLGHTYALAAGAAPVCACGGVPDGGLHYLRSGLLTCS